MQPPSIKVVLVQIICDECGYLMLVLSPLRINDTKTLLLENLRQIRSECWISFHMTMLYLDIILNQISTKLNGPHLQLLLNQTWRSAKYFTKFCIHTLRHSCHIFYTFYKQNFYIFSNTQIGILRAASFFGVLP